MRRSKHRIVIVAIAATVLGSSLIPGVAQAHGSCSVSDNIDMHHQVGGTVYGEAQVTCSDLHAGATRIILNVQKQTNNGWVTKFSDATSNSGGTASGWASNGGACANGTEWRLDWSYTVKNASGTVVHSGSGGHNEQGTCT